MQVETLHRDPSLSLKREQGTPVAGIRDENSLTISARIDPDRPSRSHSVSSSLDSSPWRGGLPVIVIVTCDGHVVNGFPRRAGHHYDRHQDRMGETAARAGDGQRVSSRRNVDGRGYSERRRRRRRIEAETG